MRNLKLHFYLLAFDVFAYVRWRRAALWAIGKAGDYVDWGDSSEWPGDPGKDPF